MPLHYITQSHVPSDWTLLIYSDFSKNYIKLSDNKIISNKNIVNYKVIDIIEYYNFDVDIFFI